MKQAICGSCGHTLFWHVDEYGADDQCVFTKRGSGFPCTCMEFQWCLEFEAQRLEHEKRFTNAKKETP